MRGCVRTASTRIYVLEENFVVYMLATSEADLAPFRVVVARRTSSLLPPEPKPSPTFYTPSAPALDEFATPAKRIKLAESQASPPVGDSLLDTLSIVEEPPALSAASPAVASANEEQAQAILAILPHIPIDAIHRALAELNNDAQVVTEALLLNPDAYMKGEIVDGQPLEPSSAPTQQAAPSQALRHGLNKPAASSQAAQIRVGSSVPMGLEPHVDLVGSDDIIVVADDDLDFVDGGESLRRLEDSAALMASQQEIDEIERRIRLEEEDMKLARQLFEEEKQRLETIESDKKRASEFDESIASVKEELLRQGQQEKAKYDQQVLQLQRELAMAQERQREIEASTASRVNQSVNSSRGTVLKKDTEFPSSWSLEVHNTHPHAMVELPFSSNEFQEVARKFLDSCGGRTFARKPDSRPFLTVTPL